MTRAPQTSAGPQTRPPPPRETPRADLRCQHPETPGHEPAAQEQSHSLLGLGACRAWAARAGSLEVERTWRAAALLAPRQPTAGSWAEKPLGKSVLDLFTLKQSQEQIPLSGKHSSVGLSPPLPRRATCPPDRTCVGRAARVDSLAPHVHPAHGRMGPSLLRPRGAAAI